MERGKQWKRFSFWPIVAFILLALPLLMLAFPQPPAGNTGAPGDSTCSSCHSGISTGGTVAVTFPSGTSYTPGIKQHLSVTVNDTTHTAWSFQLTARLASNPSGGQAGSFTATDATNTVVVANGAIQDMETTASGISQSTWSFDWSPPATNVGNVNFYVIGLAAGGAGGATSGNGIYTASYMLTPATTAAADFSLSASPSSLTLAPGASGTSTITVTPQNGFNGTVAFAASGLPSGVTASFNSSGVMTLSASSTAAAGTSTVTITGTSGSLTHTTTVALTVSAAAAPDFSIAASPAIVAISQGTSGTSTITVTPKNGFTGTVAFTASGLPSGVTASFAGGVLTLSASSTAASGTSTVTVTGTSGSLTHSTTLTLNVSAVAAPDFTLSASPASLSLTPGSSGTSKITVTPLNGFTGTVAFSTSGLPTGVTASFSSGVLTLSASSTAASGTSTVTITGTSGSLTHSTTVSLTVASSVSPTLSATPSTLSFAYQIGGTAPAPQNISVTTTGTVNYSVAFTGGSWLSVTPTTGNSSGGLTVSVTPTGLAAGTYTGNVSVTAPGATGSPQNVKVTLLVSQASTSTITVAPTSLTFTAQGGVTDEALTSQKLTITSSGAAVSYTAKETTQSGGNWLMLGSSGGSTPSTLNVSVNPAGLASGTYHGTVTINPSGAASGPQMVPVTLTVGRSTTSSLTAIPRRLTFTYGSGDDSSSSSNWPAKTIHVTSQSGARQFTAAASGGSWLTVTPTTATTPADLSVSVDTRGLASGTYSGMITLTAGTRKTSVTVTVYLASGEHDGSGDDGSDAESLLSIQPMVSDPTNSDAVGAALLDAAGVPVTSRASNTTDTQALALSKTTAAPAAAIAGAQIVPAESLTKLTELGFDVRQGGHCTATSPHFVVVTSDDVTHVFTGCANGTVQAAPASGWIRVRFDPANPAQATPPVAPGQLIKSISLVLDEGPEASPNPGGGLVVLDNLDVNGVLIGKQ